MKNLPIQLLTVLGLGIIAPLTGQNNPQRGQNQPQQNRPYYPEVHEGDWEYQQNWRYDRDAYLKGEPQPKAYEEAHPHGKGGIGYDPN